MRFGNLIAVGVAASILVALELGVASAQGHWHGMPHTITVRFEPSYVKVGDTVNVITTFIPCADIESLDFRASLPEATIEWGPGKTYEWREKAGEGGAVVISGRAAFPRPGLQSVSVTYRHPDPRRHHAWMMEVRKFRFLIPGGVLIPSPTNERETSACPTCVGNKERTGMPHSISLRLEPDSVGMDTPVRIALTFVPCVDVDSLALGLYLPKQPGAEAKGPAQQEWVGSARKDSEISLCGEAVFHRRGVYYVDVFYQHPDPEHRDPRNPRWDRKIFRIVVPGGIDVVSEGRRSPILLDVSRTVAGDTLRMMFWRYLTPETPALLTRAWEDEDTVRVMATHGVVLIPPFDGGTWQVVPARLGTFVKLSKGWVGLEASSGSGIGKILCDRNGYHYSIPLRVFPKE